MFDWMRAGRFVLLFFISTRSKQTLPHVREEDVMECCLVREKRKNFEPFYFGEDPAETGQ